MNESITKIHLLGRSYPIRCEADQVNSLQQAALYLDEKLHAQKRASPQSNLERTAITVALNLAHELLNVQQHQNSSQREVADNLKSMQKSITDTLTEQTEFDPAGSIF
jgi:cell division protein ZapA